MWLSMNESENEQSSSNSTRALVIGPYLPRRSGRDDNMRAPSERLEEAAGLAAAIDLELVDAQSIALSQIRPSTYLGKGKVEDIGAFVEDNHIGLIVMDCSLSPVQQRNLEKAWNAKVIDRTGLILEIFGSRARTREGTLQVELAHLAYQKSRLVRSWTHLERQRGGFGFLGGPGETQIEADRRLLQERMARIERDLKDVIRTRSLHRQNRKRVPYPMIALVGYTNAGKSTLFNCLTQANVVAQDMLFATLDSTARLVRMPHGERAILSDTVGFISDLPTMLVAAFKATLEDVMEADLLLHVRDVSHEDTQAQAEDVRKVLHELGLGDENRKTIIEVWNKSDKLDDAARNHLIGISGRPLEEGIKPVLVSALTGEGMDALIRQIEAIIARDRNSFVVKLSVGEGKAQHWLHENTEVLECRAFSDAENMLVVRVSKEKQDYFTKLFPNARLLHASPA
jgi:GTPase